MRVGVEEQTVKHSPEESVVRVDIRGLVIRSE